MYWSLNYIDSFEDIFRNNLRYFSLSFKVKNQEEYYNVFQKWIFKNTNHNSFIMITLFVSLIISAATLIAIS